MNLPREPICWEGAPLKMILVFGYGLVKHYTTVTKQHRKLNLQTF
jgi:hypothetical protein